MLQRTLSCLIAVVVVFAASSLAAQETGWREVYKDEHQTVLVNIGSVERTKLGVIAWVKITLETPIEMKEYNAQAHSMMQKSEFSKNRMWIRHQVMYDVNDRQITNTTTSAKDKGEELMPDTIGERVGKFLWKVVKTSSASNRKKK